MKWANALSPQKQFPEAERSPSHDHQLVHGRRGAPSTLLAGEASTTGARPPEANSGLWGGPRSCIPLKKLETRAQCRLCQVARVLTVEALALAVSLNVTLRGIAWSFPRDTENTNFVSRYGDHNQGYFLLRRDPRGSTQRGAPPRPSQTA